MGMHCNADMSPTGITGGMGYRKETIGRKCKNHEKKQLTNGHRPPGRPSKQRKNVCSESVLVY